MRVIVVTGKVVFFDTSDYDGLKEDTDYLFGGRSFTMFQVTDNGLVEVFDSKNDFEALTAEYLPEYFNYSNDELSIDNGSGKKGPETVTVGTVENKIFAFITLERIGGVMVYDITNPEKVSFVNYINSRDFSADVAGDDSPEGLKFIEASESPTGEALLMAACEVGGTVAVYELESKAIDDSNNGSNGSDNASSSYSLVTVISGDKNIMVKASSVSSSIFDSVISAVASDSSVSVIGGINSAVKVSAQLNGSTIVNFTEPVSVKIPVSKEILNSVKDINKLTLALVTKDTNGKVVLTKVGGNYDAATHTFIALIDKAGDYVLLEDNNIKKLELKVGNTISTLNGMHIANDVENIIAKDRALVPLRFICETLGGEVSWNSKRKMVTIAIDDKRISLTIGQNIEGYNVAPIIYKERTMVPIRYISDELGAYTTWIPSKKQVNITK